MASKAWAFFKRDLLVDLSYKLSFAFEAIHILIAIGAFFFLSRLLDARTLGGYDSFAFILVGLAVNAYMTTCLVCFTQVVRDSQLSGTLKAVLVTPTSRGSLSHVRRLPAFARDGRRRGVRRRWSGVRLSLARVNPVPAILVFVLRVAFSSIGMMSATSSCFQARGSALCSSKWLLDAGGVMYP